MLQALVEEAHHASVAAHPHFARDVFDGHFVVGFFKFDVSVPVSPAFGFHEAGGEIAGKVLEGGLFH